MEGMAQKGRIHAGDQHRKSRHHWDDRDGWQWQFIGRMFYFGHGVQNARPHWRLPNHWRGFIRRQRGGGGHSNRSGRGSNSRGGFIQGGGGNATWGQSAACL